MSSQMIKTAAKNWHQSMPGPIKKLYAPLFKWRYSKLYINRFNTFLPVTLIKGKAQECHSPLAIAYAGNDQEMADHWANKIFSDYKKESLGKHWIWKISRLLAKHPSAPSLCLFEKGGFTDKFPSCNPGLTIPCWFQSEIDISMPIEKLSKRKRRGFNDILRRIRKFNLSYEVTNNPRDFEHFYETMHVPYIKNRHGAESMFLSRKRIQKIFKESTLILLKKDNEVIAGDLLEQTSRGAALRLTGIKDGNLDYLRYGAGVALYYFGILEAQKRGYKKINIGGTTPFLSDGLTRFKSFINAKIVPNTYLSKKCLWMMFLKDSAALENFFVKNPVVYYPKPFLPHRALFISEEQALDNEKFKDTFSSNTFGGLKGHDVFIFSKDKNIHKKARWPDMPVGSVHSIADYLP